MPMGYQSTPARGFYLKTGFGVGEDWSLEYLEVVVCSLSTIQWAPNC